MRRWLAGWAEYFGFAVLADRLYPPYPERRRRGMRD